MTQGNWKTEFPDFDVMPVIPDSWTDTSWHNDSCPSFAAGNLRIYIDYEDAELRDVAMPCSRFGIVICEDGEVENVIDTDDWSEVLAFVVEYEKEGTSE